MVAGILRDDRHLCGWQNVRQHLGINAQRLADRHHRLKIECKRRAHAPNPQLAVATGQDVPDTFGFDRFKLVLAVRARFAAAFGFGVAAVLAVPFAPIAAAPLPFGEAAETFFSRSRRT
ncbi:hypothetical protein SPHINGOAX6_30216 [Sphingomonas sp. AX6]|nr:hypothetical protein SPHINGOAX6_30216 [Sphingomonas sp. AX6]